MPHLSVGQALFPKKIAATGKHAATEKTFSTMTIEKKLKHLNLIYVTPQFHFVKHLNIRKNKLVNAKIKLSNNKYIFKTSID
jgi:hypothetical protein